MHWTYDTIKDPTVDIEQGDILRPTEAIKDVFSQVHPHFRNDKYLGFLVATQSCDLVLRRGVPKASYINLATIRPLAHVITKIFAEVVDADAAGIFCSSAKAEGRRLLERILNQNEQTIGLFFLHEDADAGIGEHSVAFLRVTVALRADHYNAIKDARTGRLAPEFQAKLGWLIGNLYSRPATPDWADKLGGKESSAALIDKYLNVPRWIDDEIVRLASLREVDLTVASTDTLDALRPPSKTELALGELAVEMGKVSPAFDPETLKKLQNRLRNSGKFKKLFR